MDTLANAPAARNPASSGARTASGNVIALHQGIQISRHPAPLDHLTATLDRRPQLAAACCMAMRQPLKKKLAEKGGHQ